MRLSGQKLFMGIGGVFLAASIGWASPSAFHILIDGLSPYYSPYLASVSPGIPVIWRNPTASPHTVTHEGCKEFGPCVFDSGVIYPGRSFQLPPLPPGRYPYYCVLHPIMRGVLVIEEPKVPSAT